MLFAPGAEGRLQRVAACKRGVDLVLGTVLALVALPIVALLALALAAIHRTNPFFTQTRPGYRGGTHRILKLRTLPRTTPTYMSKFELDFDGMGLPWLCQG